MFSSLKKGEVILTGIGFLIGLVSIAAAIYKYIYFHSIQQEIIGLTVSINTALFGLVIAVLSLIFAMVKNEINNIDVRLDLVLKDEGKIGKVLYKIVKDLPNANDRKRLSARKRFDGLSQMLVEGGWTPENTAKALEDIKAAPNFVGITTFPMEWWFDPSGVFYLAKQLLIIAMSSSAEKSVLRYGIYSDSTIRKDYLIEFSNLCDVHKIVGGDFRLLTLEELNGAWHEELEKLEFTEERKKALRKFISKYKKETKGIWPDGLIINEKPYLRNPSTGLLEDVSDQHDSQLFIDYIKLLEVSYELPSIGVDRNDIEDYLKKE